MSQSSALRIISKDANSLAERLGFCIFRIQACSNLRPNAASPHLWKYIRMCSQLMNAKRRKLSTYGHHLLGG